MYEPELYTVQYLKPWVAERHTRVQDLLEPSMHGMSDGQGYFFLLVFARGRVAAHEQTGRLHNDDHAMAQKLNVHSLEV